MSYKNISTAELVKTKRHYYRKGAAFIILTVILSLIVGSKNHPSDADVLEPAWLLVSAVGLVMILLLIGLTSFSNALDIKHELRNRNTTNKLTAGRNQS